MKIIVTGCAGFIGSELSVRLVEDGHDVIGVDNMNPYYDIKLKEFRLEYVKSSEVNGKFTFSKMDISNRESVEHLFAMVQPDVVINLAAQAGVRYSKVNPESYIKSNVTGFHNMIDLSRRFGCKYIYASSSSVYGHNVGGKEDDILDKPLNLYAASKMCDETIADSYWNMYKYPSIGLRFFSVYGPLGRPDMLPMIVADAIREKSEVTIYGDGSAERDFTYIDDIVDGITKLVYNCDEHGVFNIGRGEPVTVNRVIELIEKYMDRGEVSKKYVQADDSESKKTLSNTEKIQKYGYKPLVSIERGLKHFCDWYLSYYGMRPDCNTCGDYEYCAFHYDECTGYIQGC